MNEVHAFEAELRKRADELRTEKNDCIEKHNAENEEFDEACALRQNLKKEIEEIFEAVGDGDLDKVRAYVCQKVADSSNAFPAPPRPIDVVDSDTNTPLSEAACYGETEIVKFLLDNGAHPNAQNKLGRTPLW